MLPCTLRTREREGASVIFQWEREEFGQAGPKEDLGSVQETGTQVSQWGHCGPNQEEQEVKLPLQVHCYFDVLILPIC
jgi:hypothetical protein